MSVSEQLVRIHLPSILQALRELGPIGPQTAPPAPEAKGFVGTLTNVMLSLLVACANPLDKESRIANLDDEQWLALLIVVHRTFYTSLLAATEGAIISVCTQQGRQIIPSRAGRSPQFTDYLNTALQHSNIAEPRKRYWREWFRGLSILRNKSAHFDTTFTLLEQKELQVAGLGHHINAAGELRTNPQNYRPIAEKVIQFIDEL